LTRLNDTLFIINGVIDASLHWWTVLSYGITPCRDASIIWFGDFNTKKRVLISTIFLRRVNDTLFIINGITMRRVNDTLFIINGVIDASLHWGTVLFYGITPCRDASIIWFNNLFTKNGFIFQPYFDTSHVNNMVQ